MGRGVMLVISMPTSGAGGAGSSTGRSSIGAANPSKSMLSGRLDSRLSGSSAGRPRLSCPKPAKPGVKPA